MYSSEDKIRLAAFKFLEAQTQYNEILSWHTLTNGFEYEGERVTLVGAQGIWKPKVFHSIPLSITSSPNSDYANSLTKDGFLIYKYRGTNPGHRDNVGLREAMKKRVPLIYFHGVAPGKYLAVWPVFVVDDQPSNLSFTVAVDDPYLLQMYEEATDKKSSVSESDYCRRKYYTYLARKRLHQGSFRIRVLEAYQSQCAFCSLKHIELLDAVHIIPDSEEKGEPLVTNGLSLCKIHHAAFDQNLMGVSPDYKIIVRDDLLHETNGPMLRYGIQGMHNRSLLLPRNLKQRPNKDLLAVRFAEFKNASFIVK